MASLKSTNSVTDDDYRFMGPTGSGKSHVRMHDISYIVSMYLTRFKDYRHPYQPTWQAFRPRLGAMDD